MFRVAFIAKFSTPPLSESQTTLVFISYVKHAKASDVHVDSDLTAQRLPN